jgi:hypothetical protein
VHDSCQLNWAELYEIFVPIARTRSP